MRQHRRRSRLADAQYWQSLVAEPTTPFEIGYLLQADASHDVDSHAVARRA